MTQYIHAVGAKIETATYTTWTDMSHMELLGQRKEISDIERICAFQNPIYFKTEQEALKFSTDNAVFQKNKDQQKIMTKCPAVFKVEIESKPNNKFIVRKIVESQLLNYPTLNHDVDPANVNKPNAFIQLITMKSKMQYFITPTNFRGDFKSLGGNENLQLNHTPRSKF